MSVSAGSGVAARPSGRARRSNSGNVSWFIQPRPNKSNDQSWKELTKKCESCVECQYLRHRCCQLWKFTDADPADLCSSYQTSFQQGVTAGGYEKVKPIRQQNSSVPYNVFKEEGIGFLGETTYQSALPGHSGDHRSTAHKPVEQARSKGIFGQSGLPFTSVPESTRFGPIEGVHRSPMFRPQQSDQATVKNLPFEAVTEMQEQFQKKPLVGRQKLLKPASRRQPTPAALEYRVSSMRSDYPEHPPSTWQPQTPQRHKDSNLIQTWAGLDRILYTKSRAEEFDKKKPRRGPTPSWQQGS